VLPVLPDGLLGEAVDVHRDTGCLGSLHARHALAGSFAISGHDAPHPHMIHSDPANRFVLQTDLGQDRIYVYRFDKQTGQLGPADTSFISFRREMDHGTSSFIPIGGCIRSRRRPLRSCFCTTSRKLEPSLPNRVYLPSQNGLPGRISVRRSCCLPMRGFCTRPTGCTTPSQCSQSPPRDLEWVGEAWTRRLSE
jgi:hypothetical protein